MKKKIFAFCGIFVALAFAFVVSISAFEVAQIVPVESFNLSGFPNGIFTKGKDFTIPSGDHPEYDTPPTFGLQLVTDQNSVIPVPVGYETSHTVDGNGFVFRYVFKASELLDYSNLYARFFFDESAANMLRHTYSLKLNGAIKSHVLGTEADMHSLMIPNQFNPVQDYWKFSVVTPSGQSVLSARQFSPLGPDTYSMITSSVFHPNAAMYTYTFEIRVSDAVNDYSIDDGQVEGADDLFDLLTDMSFDPAVSVLSRFWNIPYIRYGMVGLGIVAIYAFITRLF